MRFTGAVDEAPILTIASAATTDIGAARANMLRLTGSAAIASFGSAPSGTMRWLWFDGFMSITYNATSMILPGFGSIWTAPGDTATFVSLGGGNWRCLSYNRGGALPVLPGNPALSTAWVNFNGNGAVAIRSSMGVASVARNGVGDYTVNFASAMADTNYVVSVELGELEGNAFVYGRIPTGKQLNSFRFRCIQIGGTYADVSQIDVVVFGGR